MKKQLVGWLGVTVFCGSACSVDDDKYTYQAQAGNAGRSGTAGAGTALGGSDGKSPLGGRGGGSGRGGSSTGGATSALTGGSAGEGTAGWGGVGNEGGAGPQDGGDSSAGGTAGGDPSSGGAANGGTTSGGTINASGGNGAGGTAKGGASAGGASSAGSGGTPKGGASTGGTTSGGAGTGGTSNGCTSNPCLNGTTCTAGSGTSYTCNCGNRYVGSRCENQKFLGLDIWPTKLSADGKVVVGKACSGDNVNCPPVKVASAGGAATALAVPTNLPSGFDVSSGCIIYGVNGTGTWIGGQCNGTQGSVAVEWKDSNVGSYAAGRTADELLSVLSGSSSDGTIVAGTLYSQSVFGKDQWFRRIPTSGIVPLAAVNPGELTAATGTSNDGLVVVGTSGDHAARWDGTFATRLLAEVPGSEAVQFSLSYRATDVSGDGIVTVGYFTTRGGPTALRWNTTAVVTLDAAASARAVDRTGSRIVGSLTSTATAVTWDASGTRKTIAELVGGSPDLAGWTLSDAVGISDDGKVIVGTGTDPSQQQKGWVARLP